MERIEFINGNSPYLNAHNLNQLQTNVETAIEIGGVSGDTLPVGAIIPFGSATPPANWLVCNGQAVSRTEYELLFNVIGTTFGAGDGNTTFNVPNLKGKIPVGQDTAQTEFDTLGETGGEKTHTLTVQEMPVHNHSIALNGGSNSGTYIDYEVGDKKRYYGGQDITQNAGNGSAHNNLQPYTVTQYIIKARQSAGIVATVEDSLTSTSTTNALSANQGRILKEKIESRNVQTYTKDLSTNVTANSWQTINPEDFTLNLAQGTYRVLVSMAASNTADDGIAYLSPLVNDAEIRNNIRSSAFLKGGSYKIVLQCEGYITANGSTNFNARIYSTANTQVTGVVIYVERIS